MNAGEGTAGELDDVLGAIIDILAASRFEDKVHWLAERRSELGSKSAEERARAREAIRRIVPGMGGLMDLHLDDTTARARRDDLGERFHRLTGPDTKASDDLN